MNKIALAKLVAITAEICSGTVFSEEILEIYVEKLNLHNEQAVHNALSRCQSEVKGRLSLADIISRIDDGRPGAEEAWSMLPLSPDDTVVWTDEMSEAYGYARALSNDPDGRIAMRMSSKEAHKGIQNERIAMRMSFREAYNRICIIARQNRTPVKWSVSLGSAPGRQGPLFDALRKGRISARHVTTIAPELASELDNKTLPSYTPDLKLLEQINCVKEAVSIDGKEGNEN